MVKLLFRGSEAPCCSACWALPLCKVFDISITKPLITMKKRRLGKQGPLISEVSLGCWQLGTDWGKTLDKEKAFDLLETAERTGVNAFDTADVYGGGRSETLIGDYLGESGSETLVFTKFGRAGGIYPDGYSERSLREGVEGSLERLGKSSIDLLQLHCIPLDVLKEGAVFSWLRKIQDEGLIKSFGASIQTMEEGMLCLQQEGLASLQVIFNLFRQQPVSELLPEAEKKGVGIIVRLPLASGLLAGKFTASSSFEKTDHRNYNKDGEAFYVGETFAGLPFLKGLELVERLRNEFLPEGMDMVEFSLRWILDHPQVSCIIPGASRKEQVISIARASVLQALPEELHQRLFRFYLEAVRPHIRGEI